MNSHNFTATPLSFLHTSSLLMMRFSLTERRGNAGPLHVHRRSSHWSGELLIYQTLSSTL